MLPGVARVCSKHMLRGTETMSEACQTIFDVPQEEDVVPPSQQLDISSMTVDDDYQGPRLEGGSRSCGPSQHGICRAFACA